MVHSFYLISISLISSLSLALPPTTPLFFLAFYFSFPNETHAVGNGIRAVGVVAGRAVGNAEGSAAGGRGASSRSLPTAQALALLGLSSSALKHGQFDRADASVRGKKAALKSEQKNKRD